MFSLRAVPAASLSVLLFACGGDDSSTADGGDSGTADVAAEAAFVPGPHDPFPRAVSSGGAVLDAPHVVPVFYANDTLQSKLEDFMSTLTSSVYWTDLRNEYAVGPLTIGPSIVLADAPPAQANFSDATAFIAGKLDSADPAWPALTPNSIFVMFYPSSTKVLDGAGVGCKDFSGYHGQGQTAAQANFVFAVISRCEGLPITPLDNTTQNLAHELVEASTDPLFSSAPAYAAVDDDHLAWNYFPGGELGDLCGYENLSYQHIVGTYNVPRFWSNAQATAGHDPCAPNIAAPYYNAVPVLTDTVSQNYLGKSVVTKGVRVPAGSSKTIDVQLFSDAPTSDWTVDAKDESGNAELTFAWDATTGNNATTLHLTVTRVKASPSNGTEMMIESSMSTTNRHAYYALVGN